MGTGAPLELAFAAMKSVGVQFCSLVLYIMFTYPQSMGTVVRVWKFKRMVEPE